MPPGLMQIVESGVGRRVMELVSAASSPDGFVAS